MNIHWYFLLYSLTTIIINSNLPAYGGYLNGEILFAQETIKKIN